MTNRMTTRIERSLQELYADDAERADAIVFGRRVDVSRRGFLNGAGLAGVGAAVGATIPFGDTMPAGLIPAALAQGTPAPGAAPPAGAGQAQGGPQILDFPGKEKGLVVLGDKPLVAETPEHLLDDETTPTAKFFIRNNGLIPDEAKDADGWKIVVDGEVNQPLELTSARLKKRFQPRTYRMVLECGGNGRSFFSPPGRGNQWTNGGAGCAEWTGVPLADRAQGGGREAVGEIHGTLRRRPAPVRRHLQGVDLARHADRQGDGRARPRRLGHERRAAAAYPWRPGAAGHSRMAGIAVAQVADPHRGPRPRARRPRHDAAPPTGCRSTPMVPGGKADEKNFRILESMPVRSIVTNPANGTRLPAGTRERRPARRRLGRRSDGAARRRLDRFRRDLDARDCSAPDEPLRLEPLDREPASCPRTAITRSGRARPTRSGACSPTSPATGTRKATAATRCTASPILVG